MLLTVHSWKTPENIHLSDSLREITIVLYLTFCVDMFCSC